MRTNTAEKLLEALTVESAHIAEYEGVLGFNGTDTKDSGDDKANIEVALDNVDVFGAIGKGVTKTKDDCYGGDPTKPIPTYPATALTALPFASQNSGALSRYNNRKARAKLAVGYTAQIGIIMGYEDVPTPPVSPDSLLAALKTYKNIGGYQFEATFGKQGMSAMLIQYRIKGTEKWSAGNTALQSPVVIGITPPEGDGALEIEIRCRLLQGNTQVGSWSPIYSMTLTS